MLTSIGLRNFKPFGEQMQEVPLKKLTLIYGPNSGGKSSIIQALLLLKQSLEGPRQGFRRELMPRGNEDLGDVDLGSFLAMIHRHEAEREFEARVTFDLSGSRIGAKLYLTFEAESSATETPRAILTKLRCELFSPYKEELSNVDLEFRGGVADQGHWENKVPYDTIGIDDSPSSSTLKFLPTWKTIAAKDYNPARQLPELIERLLIDADDQLEGLTRRQLRRPRGSRGLSWRAPIHIHRDGLIEVSQLSQQLRISVERTLESEERGVHRPDLWIAANDKLGQILELCATMDGGFSDKGMLTQSFRRAWDMIGQHAMEIKTSAVDLFVSETLRLTSIPDEYEKCLRSIIHLGPVRDKPKRLYTVSGSARASTGVHGNFTPHVLHNSPETTDKVNEWFKPKRFDIPYELKVKSLGDLALSGDNILLELFDKYNKTPVTIADVGFGVSCVLPIIVEGVASPTNSILCVEQPELHLHPRLQAQLADLMIATALSEEKQWIVETHSELLIRRIQRRMKHGFRDTDGNFISKVAAEDVSILYVGPGEGETGSKISEIRLDDEGRRLDPWPRGFFEEAFEESFPEEANENLSEDVGFEDLWR